MNQIIYKAKKYIKLEGKRFSGDVIILSCKVPESYEELLKKKYRLEYVSSHGFFAYSGEKELLDIPSINEGFSLKKSVQGINLQARDYNGYLYGLGAWILSDMDDSSQSFSIEDYPTMQKRGLMLDVSRGKVYKLDTVFRIIDILSFARYNVLQLYIEHTFDFKSHPEISMGSGAYREEDILKIKEYAASHGITLQANLQSFGHCRRILKQKEHMSKRESDMFWTLSPACPETYTLLDDMYNDYLPLFDDEYFNVCSDETYDLAAENSRNKGKDKGKVYMEHILRLRNLAAKYGKKIMVFGDIVLKHPELVSDLPSDILFVDWIYDPKDYYGTPAVFKDKGRRFWVCPGTGAWNTLFPRLDGAIKNIENLVGEGIENGAEGMLLTDWNDHGGYALNAFSHFIYTFGGLYSWIGEKVEEKDIDEFADFCVSEADYSCIERLFAQIYWLPPIWSKNRSECVMALFDEPIKGKTSIGLLPPSDFEAYNLRLPGNMEPEREKGLPHPLRPIMVIPPETRKEIRRISEKILSYTGSIVNRIYKESFIFAAEEFLFICDKLNLSNMIQEYFTKEEVTVEGITSIEEDVRKLLSRLIDLEMGMLKTWFNEADRSEIDRCVMNWSGIIGRYDYLTNWLEDQRALLENNEEVDKNFETYNTCSYNTLAKY